MINKKDFKMDEFDLEQGIMDCWQVVDDIDTIYQRLDALSKDEIMNLLLGIKSLYQLKFEKLFETYETVIFPQMSDESDELANHLPPDPLLDAIFDCPNYKNETK